MLLKTVLFSVVSVVLFAAPYCQGVSEEKKEKIHKAFEEAGMKCLKDNPITEDDITRLRSHQIPTGDNAPCFMACLLKSVGVMDDKGMMQKENALDVARKTFSDEEELKNIEEYIHSCSHINSEPVTDGDKGCDRAVLSHKCMLENASKFGIEL